MEKRAEIIGEIQRLVHRDGIPPGMERFKTETGIKESEWRGRFWRAWSEALKEAGFPPNRYKKKIPADEMLERLVVATRHFGKVPAQVDLKFYAHDHPGFPAHTTIWNHFGSKQGIVEALREFAARTPGHDDVLVLLPEMKPAPMPEPSSTDRLIEGSVYLLKMGEHYKVGTSKNVARRFNEIGQAAPVPVEPIHVIKTDDQFGIEAYWKRRFADKRANGEWFKLSVGDIRAFKRRRFQ